MCGSLPLKSSLQTCWQLVEIIAVIIDTLTKTVLSRAFRVSLVDTAVAIIVLIVIGTAITSKAAGSA